MQWRYIHEEKIRQRYNWPQATPCSQLEWRTHTGWRASFPISLWEGGKEGFYLQGGGFPGRGIIYTACAAHIRLFVTQACSPQADHSAIKWNPFQEQWKETLRSWSHTLVPGTKPESNGWPQKWLLVSLWWGTDFHFFRLEKWNQYSLTSPLPYCLQSSCYRHGQPAAQGSAAGSSPFPLLGFCKNISINFP